MSLSEKFRIEIKTPVTWADNIFAGEKKKIVQFPCTPKESEFK